MGHPTSVSFTRAELKSFTGATLPDLIAPGVRLLFVGINPGLRSVAVQGHFAPRGNRFYPALLRAGITDHLIDASAGLTPDDRDYLLRRGVGITSLVARATASAAELGPAELAEGARALASTIDRFRPRAVAILGVTAYRTAFSAPGPAWAASRRTCMVPSYGSCRTPAGGTLTRPLTRWPPPTARWHGRPASACSVSGPAVRPTPPPAPPPAPGPGERGHRGRLGLGRHGLRRPEWRAGPPRLAHAGQFRPAAVAAADERNVFPYPGQPSSQAHGSRLA